MLDGLSLVSIRECSMDASGPIPSSCVQDIRFPELCSAEADIGFLAGTPAIIRLEISITRAKQAFEFPAAHTVVHFVLLLSSGPESGGPSENAGWTFPGIHQRMLDGRPLVSIRECSMNTSGPIPSSCAAEIRFLVLWQVRH